MKIIILLILLLIALTSLSFSRSALNGYWDTSFKASINTIPEKIKITMRKYTWHPGCPVTLSELAYVELSYWGFDDKPHMGILIVNKELAKEVVGIFKILYMNKFPIQRMEPMDVFKGSDIVAMEANNTSSFNCRAKTGKPGIFSQHSYGRAIDINTLINPYINGTNVLPKSGYTYIDRNKPYPGKITKGSLIYNEFIKHGWIWGGDWVNLKDYQHFEKPK